ncbi:CsgG/HfaB family protein [Akkermansiaceae bacterium]|nr:CsgG/HfaB family protein [Akkermansiaceae bacterium]
MKYLQLASLFFSLLFLTSCSSTSSTMVNTAASGEAAIAVLPLQGESGEQMSDLIIEQLALNGVATVERAQIDSVLREHSYRSNANFDNSSFARYGKLLGVKKVITGTISKEGGPLYSFDHVNITLKVVDVATGKVTWIGRYGNSLWTSAISTQGDMQRGAKHIVKEFVAVHGTKF